MQDGRFVTRQLLEQYDATFEMLQAAVDKCPEAVWEDGQSSPAYWHEAYHALFWCDNFVGDRTKAFEFCPVGVDIDPRLFTQPAVGRSRGEVLAYVAEARKHVAERLEAMVDDDLGAEDTFGEAQPEFDVVLHRLLYGLRHGQHHVGKLASRLRSAGIEFGVWCG